MADTGHIFQSPAVATSPSRPHGFIPTPGGPVSTVPVGHGLSGVHTPGIHRTGEYNRHVVSMLVYISWLTIGPE